MSAASGTAILLMLAVVYICSLFFNEMWSYNFLHVVTTQIYFVIKLYRFRFWIRLCYTFISGVKGIFFSISFSKSSGIEKLIFIC